MDKKSNISTAEQSSDSPADSKEKPPAESGSSDAPPKEIGGRGGLEPTRYGDWEKNGRCIDF